MYDDERTAETMGKSSEFDTEWDKKGAHQLGSHGERYWELHSKGGLFVHQSCKLAATGFLDDIDDPLASTGLNTKVVVMLSRIIQSPFCIISDCHLLMSKKSSEMVTISCAMLSARFP